MMLDVAVFSALILRFTHDYLHWGNECQHFLMRRTPDSTSRNAVHVLRSFLCTLNMFAVLLGLM